MMGVYEKQMRHQSKLGLERFKSKYPVSCFLLSSAQMPLWSLTHNGLCSFGKIALVASFLSSLRCRVRVLAVASR